MISVHSRPFAVKTKNRNGHEYSRLKMTGVRRIRTHHPCEKKDGKHAGSLDDSEDTGLPNAADMRRAIEPLPGYYSDMVGRSSLPSLGNSHGLYQGGCPQRL